MEKSTNKKDYLKKYLAGGDKKRKKKKLASTSHHKSKIIDDDIDLKNIKPIDDNELDIYDLAEDAPQIVGIVDDRPEEIRVMSQYRETKKWKVVTREYEDVQVSALNSDSDVSVNREPTARSSQKKKKPSFKPINSDSDVSVKRKKHSDSDISPPRKKSQHHASKKETANDSDASPPRKNRHSRRGDSDSDPSPPRRRKHQGSDSDQSPKRKKHDRSKNEHNPREHHSHSSRSRKEDIRRESSRDKMSKTLDGKKAGLQNANDMKKEAAELRRKQNESLSKLGDDVSGRGASTIHRDKKTGKRRDFKEEARQQREKEAKEAEIIEKYAVWGKGMKQIDDKANKMKEELHEMSKPMARYADDQDLEEMLRNEERDGDPMLEYMRKKRRKEGGGDAGGKTKPSYQGSYLPNRYNIKPGHRWDGVDRSNGFEQKWFDEKSNRKALEEEAFKWSTEDM